MFGFLKRGHGLFLENHSDTETPVGEVVRGTSHAIPEGETVSTALRLCLEGYRNIAVSDKDGKIFKGMVTSRSLLDFLGGGSLHQEFVARKEGLKTPVSRIMEKGVIQLDRNAGIGEALETFKRTGEDALPLVSKGRLDGVVTEGDVVRQLAGETGVRVWEVMTSKPVVAKINHPVSEVAGMLVRGGFRRLPVVRDDFLTGIVGASDILRYLNGNKKLRGLRKDRNEIQNAMNKVVESIGPGADVHEAARAMCEKGVCMLPVVDEYQILGVLTHRDILDAM
jgi:CBS domain-containing protein